MKQRVTIKDWGQTLGEFMLEVKDLTIEDRAYFAKLFPSVGIEIARVG